MRFSHCLQARGPPEALHPLRGPAVVGLPLGGCSAAERQRARAQPHGRTLSRLGCLPDLALSSTAVSQLRDSSSKAGSACWLEGRGRSSTSTSPRRAAGTTLRSRAAGRERRWRGGGSGRGGIPGSRLPKHGPQGAMRGTSRAEEALARAERGAAGQPPPLTCSSMRRRACQRTSNRRRTSGEAAWRAGCRRPCCEEVCEAGGRPLLRCRALTNCTVCRAVV